LNKKMIIISLALIFITIMLPTTTVKAQAQEQNMIIAHNFKECVGTMESLLSIRISLSQKPNIDYDDPAFLKVSEDVCKFYKQEFGDYAMYHIAEENGLKNDKFLSKYYPNGFPDAVEEIMAPLDLSSLK